MSDGYVPKSITPISGNIDLKPDVSLQYSDALAGAPNASAAASPDLAHVGDVRLRKISPYESVASAPSAPGGHSMTGLSAIEQPFSQKLLERFSSFFSLPSQNDRSTSTGNLDRQLPTTSDGESPKTRQALQEFEKMQQVSVGYALLSSLTQSVLSSVKRLTQGQ